MAKLKVKRVSVTHQTKRKKRDELRQCADTAEEIETKLEKEHAGKGTRRRRWIWFPVKRSLWPGNGIESMRLNFGVWLPDRGKGLGFTQFESVFGCQKN